MTDHRPAWCQPHACSCGDKAYRSVREAHRGQLARVAGTGGTVTSRLVQAPGEDPRVQVVSSGWAHTKAAELSVQEARDLRDNLDEQIQTAELEQADPGTPGPSRRPG